MQYNEKDFLKRAQHFAKSLFYQGDVSYLEAVNQATLANAFERYGNMGVIRFKRTKGSKSLPLLGLSPEWRPARGEDGTLKAEGKLWDFLSRLGTFRREGKNRRGQFSPSSNESLSVHRLLDGFFASTCIDGKVATYCSTGFIGDRE